MPTFREILEKLKINAAKVLRGKDPEDCLPVVSKDYNDLIDVLKELDSNGTVTSVSIAPANGFSGSSSGGATPALTINLQDANTSQDGKLIASDWNTFNNKQNSLIAGDNITIDTTDPLAPIINSTGAVPINSNIVAKGTGSGITESQIYDNGDKVGVGTEFSDAKLQIDGSSNLSNELTLKTRNSDNKIGLIVDNNSNAQIGKWLDTIPRNAKLTIHGDDDVPTATFMSPQLFDYIPDLTTLNQFNNTTDNLVVVLDSTNYPSVLSRLYANAYVQIEDELMKCILVYEVTPTTRSYTFVRGQLGTTISAHGDNNEINIKIPFAFHLTENGCLGMGTDNPFDTIELHIKSGLKGGISIYQDDELQLPDGNYGVFHNRGEAKGICKIFLCESGGIGLMPYDPSGVFRDPLDSLHIGANGRLAGGIRMDSPEANILFSNANQNGGIIQNLGSGNGWLKLFGDNGVFDVAGKTGEDLRIGTDGNGTNGKGIYFKALGNSGWTSLIKMLNTNSSSYPSLELIPDGNGEIKVSGLTGWSGTYATGDVRTVTVTKGIITNVA